MMGRKAGVLVVATVLLLAGLGSASASQAPPAQLLRQGDRREPALVEAPRGPELDVASQTSQVKSFSEASPLSAAWKGDNDDEDDDDDDATAEHRRLCGAVKQCFCMRHTLDVMNNVCGWCESEKVTMLGGPAGPKKGQCSRWIWSHKDCPNMWCAEDWTTRRVLGVVCPPALFGLIWLWARRSDRPSREAQKPQFLQQRITQADFSNGLRGDRRMMISAPFQNYFPYAPGLYHLLVQIGSSCIFRSALVHASRFGFFTCLFYTVLRLTPVMLDRLSYHVLSSTLESIKSLSTTLGMSVGFMFSFYVLGRVSWWWQVIDHCRSMQGRTHDIGLLVSGYAHVKECRQNESASKRASWLEAKWNLYRFLMLSWIMCYKSLSKDFEKIQLEDLVEAGYLEESESRIMAQCVHRRKAPLVWLSAWIEHHIEDMQVRALILDKLCALRGTMGALHDACELRAPMSFEGLMYTLVFAWVCTLPEGRLDDLGNRRIVLEQGTLIATLSVACTCLFYMFMITLLEIFKDPFGLTEDALSVATILLESETTLWDFLTVPAAECLEHTLCNERFTLPQERLARASLELEASSSDAKSR